MLCAKYRKIHSKPKRSYIPIFYLLFVSFPDTYRLCICTYMYIHIHIHIYYINIYAWLYLYTVYTQVDSLINSVQL